MTRTNKRACVRVGPFGGGTALTLLMLGCAAEPTHTYRPATPYRQQPRETQPRERTPEDYARQPAEALARLRTILLERRRPADLSIVDEALAHAEAIANALVAAHPALAEAFYLRGRVRTTPARAQGTDEVGALSDFDKALQLDPTMARCLNERAVLHFRRQDYDRALSDIDMAITLAGASPQAADYMANREAFRERVGAMEAARKLVAESLTFAVVCGHYCARTIESQPPIDAVTFDASGSFAVVQHVPIPRRGEPIKGPTFTLYRLRDGQALRSVRCADGEFFHVDAFGPSDCTNVLIRWKENLQSYDFTGGGRNWSMAVDDPVQGREMLIATGASGHIALMVSPRGRVDLLHVLGGDLTPIPWSDEVHAIAFCDGRSLALAVPRGIDIVSLPLGVGTTRVPVEDSRILAMAFMPDGRRIAALGAREIFVADLESGSPVWRADRPASAMRVAVSTSGKLLALVGREVTIHSAETGEIIARVGRGDSQTAFSSAAFSPQDEAVYVGTFQGSIVRFDFRR
jgi:Flp pilus assembly protein TadD